LSFYQLLPEISPQFTTVSHSRNTQNPIDRPGKIQENTDQTQAQRVQNTYTKPDKWERKQTAKASPENDTSETGR
jgi:hypothetical protein